MATIIAFSSTVERIIKEVEKFDEIEQESILASLRTRQLLKQPRKNIASVSKPLSMTVINNIKHKSRKDASK